VERFIMPTGVVVSADPDQNTVETLLQILATAFDDPDRVRNASRYLATLKQGNKEFSEFYADFQKHAAIVDWTEQTKRDNLMFALSHELQTQMVSVDEPATWDALIALLTRTDTRLRSLRSPAPRTSSAPSKPAAPKAAHPTSSGSGHYGPAPMDLSAGRRRGPLSSEERIRRMSQGLCLYCGGAGHMAIVCPNNRRPAPVRAAATLLDTTTPGRRLVEEIQETKN